MYLLRSDRLAAGGNGAIAVSLGEDGKELDAVADGREERVMAMLGAELSPDGPKFVTGVGVAETQSLAGLFFSNAECTAESISGRAVTICQGCG